MCLALWWLKSHNSHLPDLSWQVQIWFGTFMCRRLLLRSFPLLRTGLWPWASGHWSGSRWDWSELWLWTCLLPARAIQCLVQRLIPARWLFSQSGLLAHSERKKKRSALCVGDLAAKLAGIFLSKPKADI